MRGRLAIVIGALVAATGIAGAAASWPAATTVETAMKDLDLIRPSRQKLAVDFTVKIPGGGTFKLSEQRGKVVFINFWATWCLPCREEMPSMERLFQRTRRDGLVMLAVSVDADAKVITPFLKEQRFTFTVGLDPKMELASTYGVRALPSSFIVDREGYLAALALGPRAWDNAASQALVEGLSR
jgi:peroxiredoxin